jgi:hypothetical protein
MTNEYIYCLSNKSMPNIYKFYITNLIPQIILEKANKHSTFRPPTPYKIEFYRKLITKIDIHDLLEVLNIDRIESNKDFYYISHILLKKVEQTIDLFNINGEESINSNENKQFDGIEEKNINSNDTEQFDGEEEEKKNINPNDNKCRDMSKCFTNGQKIRHIIPKNEKKNIYNDDIWTGIYNRSTNKIKCDQNNKLYGSPSAFAGAHQTLIKKKIRSANGWAECECEIDNIWTSIYNLPYL